VELHNVLFCRKKEIAMGYGKGMGKKKGGKKK
jgi:hypothetical protein